MDASPTAVTVVVANYNQSAFVADCLASVARQDHGDVSVIVTDDCSQDDSRHVIEQTLRGLGLSARRVFNHRNLGVCATFNRALRFVETPYVAFIAADDWMLPHRLSTQVAALGRAGEDTAIVAGNMLVAREDGSLTGELWFDRHPEPWPGAHPDPTWDLLFSPNWIAAGSALMRTAHVRAVGGYDERLLFEDLDLWLRLSTRYRLLVVEDALTVYRQVESSLSRRLGSSERSRAVTELVMMSKQIGIRTDIDAVLVPKVFHLAVRHLKAGVAVPDMARILRRVSRTNPSLVALAWAVAATGAELVESPRILGRAPKSASRWLD